MPAAVAFDDYSRPMAGEVGEVGTDRSRSPKVVVFKRRLPQMLPKFLFGFGRVTTQRASAGNALVNRTLRSLWHPPPHPRPLPTPPFARGVRGPDTPPPNSHSKLQPQRTAPPPPAPS